MSLKSILFVPALRIDLLEKAVKGAATAICIDLEDSIAPELKSEARARLGDCISLLGSASKTALLRVNSEPELLSADLKHLSPEFDYVVLPKVVSSGQVDGVGSELDRLFGGGGPGIVGLVESGADLDRLRQDTEPLHARVAGMALGTEDLSADFSTNADAEIIRHCYFELGILCRRWNVSLLGYPGSIAEYKDLERFRLGVWRGVEAGASGGFCIHPSQVDVLNSAFSPSDEAVANAQRIVDAFEAAIAKGEGVCSLNGKMIDRPIYLNAKAVLSRAM
ncbi:HpcH/HpaI aldolase/citrate lyase family protein [Hoeflea prorocentri]|uniref:Aldolase/citrate lyase family protein n=1 Tax=Hoeflea prorocentri TaxID=1922333 RepID=A0A9X3UF77_9HYPH|nr:aldolase/citrate lyase family protein [Hoeflea prorocentri]MCY6379642.1 aldolase/citrate lyase family protein [Hoeflea prorocentri]MDA5397442.1 aldolase/citrate lyase family protein [Hoeflea prorocentri]